MPRVPFACVIACLALSLGLASCRPLFRREVAGRILALEGNATGKRGAQEIALTSKGLIYPGETISAHADARLDLMLVPGILVELIGDTEIEITELHLARDGDETIRPMTVRGAIMRVTHGTVVASVGEAQTDPRLIVATPQGTLTADAARTFRVDVAEGKTRILSVRRQVVIRAAGAPAELKIPAGYFATLPAATPNLRSAAEEDAEAQALLHATFEVEKRLLRLEDQHRDDFRPW